MQFILRAKKTWIISLGCFFGSFTIPLLTTRTSSYKYISQTLPLKALVGGVSIAPARLSR